MFFSENKLIGSTVLFLSIILGVADQSRAAIETFYGLDGGAANGGAHPNSDIARMQFLASLSLYAVGTQDFEAFDGNHFNLLGQSISFPDATVTGLVGPAWSAGNAIVTNATTPEFPVSGSNYLFTSGTSHQPFFEIIFSEPIFAIGFYGVGISDYFGYFGSVTSEQVILDGANPINILNVNPTEIPNYSVNYFGLISSTSFTNIRFYNPGPANDTIGIDDITVAIAVPEVKNASLLIIAACCFVGCIAVQRASGNG